MIEHIVLFKWQEEATEEQITEALNSLNALKDQIQGIIDLSCGENFSERNQGFQHALIVKFNDRTSLEEYFPHPAHQEVVKNQIRPILADILSIDYEHCP